MIQQEPSDIQKENTFTAAAEKTASNVRRISVFARQWKMEFPVSPL